MFQFIRSFAAAHPVVATAAGVVAVAGTGYTAYRYLTDQYQIGDEPNLVKRIRELRENNSLFSQGSLTDKETVDDSEWDTAKDVTAQVVASTPDRIQALIQTAPLELQEQLTDLAETLSVNLNPAVVEGHLKVVIENSKLPSDEPAEISTPRKPDTPPVFEFENE